MLEAVSKNMVSPSRSRENQSSMVKSLNLRRACPGTCLLKCKPLPSKVLQPSTWERNMATKKSLQKFQSNSTYLTKFREKLATGVNKSPKFGWKTTRTNLNSKVTGRSQNFSWHCLTRNSKIRPLSSFISRSFKRMAGSSNFWWLLDRPKMERGRQSRSLTSESKLWITCLKNKSIRVCLPKKIDLPHTWSPLIHMRHPSPGSHRYSGLPDSP